MPCRFVTPVPSHVLPLRHFCCGSPSSEGSFVCSRISSTIASTLLSTAGDVIWSWILSKMLLELLESLSKRFFNFSFVSFFIAPSLPMRLPLSRPVHGSCAPDSPAPDFHMLPKILSGMHTPDNANSLKNQKHAGFPGLSGADVLLFYIRYSLFFLRGTFQAEITDLIIQFRCKYLLILGGLGDHLKGCIQFLHCRICLFRRCRIFL